MEIDETHIQVSSLGFIVVYTVWVKTREKM